MSLDIWEGKKAQGLIDAVKEVGRSISVRGNAEWVALLNGSNYKTVMKQWFLANGCAAYADLSDLCDTWYTMTRTGWTGGVKFPIPAQDAAASSDGVKTGDNYGLSCTPSTEAVANTDDYANLPMFACVDCNVYLDSTGKPHVTAIDGIAGNFKRSDPTKIVGVLQMTGFKRAWVDTDAGYYGWDYTDLLSQQGFHPLPEAVELSDNSVRPWVVHGKYAFGPDWSCCSNQQPKVFDVSHNAQLSGVRTKWGNRYCGFTSADCSFILLMLYLKYGRLDSDRILHGCCGYNYEYNPAAGETGVERILLTAAQAANLVVGSTVTLASSKRSSSAVVNRKKITKIEATTVSGIDYSAVYVDNDGTTFDTTTSLWMSTMPWFTGSTDNVLGNDGGINPSSDKYPVKIQGIEIMIGCTEVVGDSILVYGLNDGINCCTPWVCRDASKLSTSKTSDYAAAHGIPTPGSSSWQYPKQMREGTSLPELIFPIDIGGSSSAGPRDGFYLLNNSSGSYEWLRFGGLSGGLAGAGFSCGDGNYGLSRADWSFGGRLSLTGNRGEFQPAA